MIRERLVELERRGDVRESARLRVELVRRWTLPFVCIAFAFLGVPLAVASRGGRGSAYLVTLAVFVGVYALSRFGGALAENGPNAWVARLLPNARGVAPGAPPTRPIRPAGGGKRP